MKPLFFRNQALSGTAAAALGLALIVGLGTPPAAAQFICGGSATGGESQSADGAMAAGGPNVACGTAANASSSAGSFNTAIGNSANASSIGGGGSINTATGRSANASGFSSLNTATGSSANASGSSSANTATGNSANAGGGGSFNVAMGNDAQAMGGGTSNTAIGSGSRANFANSAAFGNSATATRANQQVFGTGVNTYTMGGITSLTSKAEQGSPTQVVTSDAAGNLATTTLADLGFVGADLSGINSQISGINSRIGSLSSRIDDVNREARRGIAATAALAYAPTPSGPGRTTFAINGSVYEGVGGVGLSFQHRFAGAATPVYFSGAYGNGGGRQHVGRAGFGFEF